QQFIRLALLVVALILAAPATEAVSGLALATRVRGGAGWFGQPSAVAKNGNGMKDCKKDCKKDDKKKKETVAKPVVKKVTPKSASKVAPKK
ncbi:hypothetical protein T492DRAFT_977273, partial [Pavlovales sp. CCMP2436]